MEGRRSRGQHGKKGESKSLIILEILKSSFTNFENAKSNKLMKEGFIPVDRTALKWALKREHKIKTKNADALIRTLINEKAIKEKNSEISLNYKTSNGLTAITDVLCGSNYYLLLGGKNPEIKKSNEKPFLRALNKAFSECFISVYGDIPFPYHIAEHHKWNEIALNAIRARKRVDLNDEGIKEILSIAEKLRGKLTVRFKLMYILMASRLMWSANDENGILKTSFVMLSMSGYPRPEIDGWGIEKSFLGRKESDILKANRVGTRIKKKENIPFIVYCFSELMEMSEHNELIYLNTGIQKYEETILNLKFGIEAIEIEPFMSVADLLKGTILKVGARQFEFILNDKMDKHIKYQFRKASKEYRKYYEQNK